MRNTGLIERWAGYFFVKDIDERAALRLFDIDIGLETNAFPVHFGKERLPVGTRVDVDAAIPEQEFVERDARPLAAEIDAAGVVARSSPLLSVMSRCLSSFSVKFMLSI